MTANGEEENLNQHRRPSLERLDEICHRENRVSQKTKRRNGESPSGIHGKTQVNDALPQLVMVLAFCILGTISSFPWNMISTIIAATALFFVVLTFRRIMKQDSLKRERKEKLKDPFEIHFLIPNATEHKVSYYPQDNEEHHVDELSLPSDSEADIVIWMKPRLNVVLSQLWFGCYGENDAKPEPLYYFNWWVKEGPRKKITPEEDKGQYRDITNYYHIMYYDRAMPQDEIHLTGLRIRAKKKGSYDFYIGIVMPEGRAEKKLKINVV
jgi:hypothetical protein